MFIESDLGGPVKQKHIELVAMNHHYLFFELEDFFASAHECGFQSVELWTAPQHFFMDYQQNDPVTKITRLMDRYSIQVMGLCPEQTNPKPHNMAAKDPSIQERVYLYFTRAIDVAKEIGASQVLVTSGWAFYSEPLTEARKRSVEMLKRVSSYAERKSINLAMEALRAPESLIANSVEDLHSLIKKVDCPALKVCLDIGAMVAAGDTIQGYFDTFGSDVIHSHFVDCGERSLHLSLGDGERNIAQDIEEFARNEYRGVLSVECTDAQASYNPKAADARSMATYKRAYEAIDDGAHL
ncbi:TIM barrel protein [Thermophilibacter immobilis]|uniref:TIM barrel protein n=1 Tax=Thermophilibacter immobilis TaxID=2779519 RepID=A0A7S7M8E1_9ACTN|nr:TIM barrel protein [Thermophilibacter immobilis]